jgi:hypothetical protein
MSKGMTRFLGGLAAISVASTLVTGSATSASADAGSAIAAGLFGGAAGMMLGAAVARPAPVVVYEPAPVYVEAVPPRPCAVWSVGRFSMKQDIPRVPARCGSAIERKNPAGRAGGVSWFAKMDGTAANRMRSSAA